MTYSVVQRYVMEKGCIFVKRKLALVWTQCVKTTHTAMYAALIDKRLDPNTEIE